MKRYMAILNAESVGYEMTAFISVSIDQSEHREMFLAELQEVQECHHVAGKDEYLLKVRCLGTK